MDDITPTSINRIQAIIREKAPTLTAPKSKLLPHPQKEPDSDVRNRIVAEEAAKNTRRREYVASLFGALYASHVNVCSPLEATFDEKHPQPAHCTDEYPQSLIRVDTLDALWLFGLKTEFWASRRWVETRLESALGYGTKTLSSLSSRVIGGLLSAFDLSNRPIFLTRAVKLGESIADAYKKDRVLPERHIASSIDGSSKNDTTTIGLDEIGKHQLEFAFIAQHTIMTRFAQTALGAMHHVAKNSVDEGVAGFPNKWDVANGGKPLDRLFSLNSGSARFYELLFKLHRLTYKRTKWINGMWKETANSILQHLAVQSSDLIVLRELDLKDGIKKSDAELAKEKEELAKKSVKMSLHVCGVAGVFGLYAQDVDYSDKEASDFLTLAEGLIATCMQAYRQNNGKLATEFMDIQFGHVTSLPQGHGFPDLDSNWRIFESLMYMSRLTGDPKYREHSWELFELVAHNFELSLPSRKSSAPSSSAASAKAKVGRNYTTLEARFLTKVLKFLFLTFSDADVFPVETHVWNADGHPLTRFKPDPKLVV